MGYKLKCPYFHQIWWILKYKGVMLWQKLKKH